MSIITPTATDHGLGAGITPSGLMLDGEEQVVLCASLRITLMTLWIIARSPLMIGGDLPSSTPETIALFTNPDVLAALDSHGSREVFREGNLVLWTADGDRDELGSGVEYVAAFNLGSEPLTVSLDSQNVGLPAAPVPPTSSATKPSGCPRSS